MLATYALKIILQAFTKPQVKAPLHQHKKKPTPPNKPHSIPKQPQKLANGRD